MSIIIATIITTLTLTAPGQKVKNPQTMTRTILTQGKCSDKLIADTKREIEGTKVSKVISIECKEN